MTTQNPATPAPAATPGSTPNVVTTPSPATPVVPPEGKVTISTKEFAQLQRDAARGKSAQRRRDLGFSKTSATTPADGSDPTAVAIAEANQRAADAERKNLQLEVKGRVSELLEKEEFKSLPKSTKALILKNPALISEADNLEEALLDIEDFVRDSVLSLDNGGAATIPGMGGTAQPAGHDTPPKVNAGNPAPSKPDEQEDLSKLTGSARSQAAIRNALKARKK